MKLIVSIILVISASNLAFSQSGLLQQGNNCYKRGEYACAIQKYKELVKLSIELESEIAKDNLKQAEKCFEISKIADTAFNQKNYEKANEYYLSILAENPGDEYAKSRLYEIKFALITIDVSKDDLKFAKSGGKDTIFVKTESESYTVGPLPYWCSMQKRNKFIVIICGENPLNSERKGEIKVTAGDKTKTINIKQSGEPEIMLSVSARNINISAEGGDSERIIVSTNANGFSVSEVPVWCTVNYSKTYFIVSCSPNTSSLSRSCNFDLSAGDKKINVSITQTGKDISNIRTKENTGYLYNQRSNSDFNNPQMKDYWGITVGYSQLDNFFKLHSGGMCIGLCFEPLFKYGFALNTGLMLNAYFKDGTFLKKDFQFGYYGLNVPLHLEYRLNFSKKFSIFIFGGGGFNAFTNFNFNQFFYPATVEYGGGIRIGHVQFNVGRSVNIGDYEFIDKIGKEVKPFQRGYILCSYMF